MAQIGTFTRIEDGTFSGAIRTLRLNEGPFCPDRQGQRKAPDLRAYAGAIEIGVAWKRSARETGREFFSVKLDDPSFPAPIFANLVEVDGGYALVWSR
jgi:uncharacterized protein (DUF736 family)